MSFHFFLSATNSLHLLTPSTWRFLSTSFFHLFPSLPVLEWRLFWASYPPPFSLADLTRLSFALWSTSLYFLLCSSHLDKTIICALILRRNSRDCQPEDSHLTAISPPDRSQLHLIPKTTGYQLSYLRDHRGKHQSSPNSLPLKHIVGVQK